MVCIKDKDDSRVLKDHLVSLIVKKKTYIILSYFSSRSISEFTDITKSFSRKYSCEHIDKISYLPFISWEAQLILLNQEKIFKIIKYNIRTFVGKKH